MVLGIISLTIVWCYHNITKSNQINLPDRCRQQAAVIQVPRNSSVSDEQINRPLSSPEPAEDDPNPAQMPTVVCTCTTLLLLHTVMLITSYLPGRPHNQLLFLSTREV